MANEGLSAESAPIHRYRRFKGWDYAKGASLFITIATAPRQALFGRIVNGEMALSELGRVVADALEAMPRLNPGLSLFGRVVMPDHVHFNCRLAPGLKAPLELLGRAVRRFKNHTTAMAKRMAAEHSSAFRPAWPSSPAPSSPLAPSSPEGQTAFGRGRGQKLWQQGYHDYLLVSRSMIEATERYIAYNPLKWELMHGSGGGLRVTEPLCSPRLYMGDYWKGVGNLLLLEHNERLVSLRVSRAVDSPEAISQVVRRMERAVDKGYVVISGFISKGERTVGQMLCRRRDARFIRMLPGPLPNRRYKPESAYVEPLAENRYLELARGNDETEFGRAACLDLNAEIIEIATSCEGLALYWKSDGPHVIAKSGICE